ncbi:hypothetical protein VXI04_002551 [Vibrio vulnificus]|nr:hypothetical protein [Vibrio vulnificus]EHZ2754240.1 hypothetical protein [Vibrio vulnificus]EHZ2763289.1 hypothetical protein [Vibrio vulnificus]EKD8802963.1 hypothetical protein [Vibrio vulnificus]EKD9321567.1 hypothetical protein [Vibrio vulnificus]
MLSVCGKKWRKRSQLCGAKQEQDLFLRFSTKKAVDSLEKLVIVPILVANRRIATSIRVFRTDIAHIVGIGSTGLDQIVRMSRLKFCPEINRRYLWC